MTKVYCPNWTFTKDGYYDIALPKIVTVQILFETETNMIHDFIERTDPNKKLLVLMDASEVEVITEDIIKAFNRSMAEAPEIKIATHSESKAYRDVRLSYLKNDKNTSNNLDFETRDEAVKWLLNA